MGQIDQMRRKRRQEFRDRIKRLEADNAALREALKPMVREWKKWEKRFIDIYGGTKNIIVVRLQFTKAELEAAHALGGDEG